MSKKRPRKGGDGNTLDLFDDEKKTKAGGGKGGGGKTPPPARAQGDDDSIDLGAFAERSYLTYAMSVVRGRAIPNVEDGQKPVQRRILYVMDQLGLRPGAKPIKSARIVGEVLGKYHPHGDAATYEAMVRMAQNFTLRYPLIDGQGNFGTADGDSAAAYRYTEARLTPIADLLLSEIDQDTVDFVPSYDGAFREPELLPARLPILLLNGASGVAVGMACEFQPHNLREVAEAAVQLLQHPRLTTEKLLEHVLGPDFPGGAQIISSRAEMLETYDTGRGSLRARCRWKVEELARGQWRVVVTELPPTTSATRVMEEIEALVDPKAKEKGGKVTQEQQNKKALLLSQLEKISDESDKNNKVRLVLEPRSSRLDADEFMKLLLAHTSLEENFPVNMVVLGRDGRPGRKNLKALLEEWLAFRVETVTRRAKHRLGEVERRIHILDGRKTVYLNITEVIKIIRASDEPKPALMKRFKLSDVQAEDILEIRLRQLARLEGFRIDEELKTLKTEQKSLKELLGSETAMKKQVAAEIRADAKKYGDERRTLVEEAGRTVAEAKTLDEPVTVIVSRNGWLRSRQGHGLDLAGVAYKEGDGPYAVFETRTIHPIAMIDSTGRAFSIQASDIPGSRGDGVPFSSMVELAPGARVVHVLDAQPGKKYLVSTSAGYGFVVASEELVTRVRAGKGFMSIEEGEQILRPAPAPAGWEKGMVATVSRMGKLLLFPASEMRELARGRGLILMGADADDPMVAAGFSDGDSVTVEGTGRSGKPKTVTVSGKDLAKYKLRRARRGYLLPEKMTPAAIAQAV
jgi:topoisomerase IV subunit A